MQLLVTKLSHINFNYYGIKFTRLILTVIIIYPTKLRVLKKRVTFPMLKV